MSQAKKAAQATKMARAIIDDWARFARTAADKRVAALGAAVTDKARAEEWEAAFVETVINDLMAACAGQRFMPQEQWEAEQAAAHGSANDQEALH